MGRSPQRVTPMGAEVDQVAPLSVERVHTSTSLPDVSKSSNSACTITSVPSCRQAAG